METDETLRRFVLEVYAAVNGHDEVGLEERLALVPEASMLGTDAEEVGLGGDAILGMFRRQFKEFADVSFEPGDVIASSHGDAGWFLDSPTLVFGEERFPCRLTGTVLRLDGQWKMVQSHMSIPRA